MSRVAEEELRVQYREHPRQDSVGLRGEVHFPNLLFSSTGLDFGCVLNHTESQRQLTMTNSSPLAVAYRWAFLVDQHRYAIRYTPCLFFSLFALLLSHSLSLSLSLSLFLSPSLCL